MEVSGEKLRQMREKRGFSQKRLEELTGYAQQSISLIEKGEKTLRDMDIATRLARALSCEMYEITNGELTIDNPNAFTGNNLHLYLKATRELLGLQNYEAADCLNMNEKEYSDYEKPENAPNKDECRKLAASLFFTWFANRLTAEVRNIDKEDDTTGNVSVFRSLPPEKQTYLLELSQKLK